MALKDELLSLISRYTGGRVHRDGGGSVSTADILDGMSAADMTRDLRQGPPVAPPVAGPDVRRRLQDKVMRGIPLSPLEHEQLRMYVEQELPQRREIKAQELGIEDAGRMGNAVLKTVAPPIPGYNFPTFSESAREFEAQRAANLERRGGMSEGERALDLAKEYGMEAAPYALPAMAQKATPALMAAARSMPKATAGGLSLAALFSPSQAGDKEGGDPRMGEISKLEQQIAADKKKLEDMGKQFFQSTPARDNAAKPYLGSIDSAQRRIQDLQREMREDAEKAKTGEQTEMMRIRGEAADKRDAVLRDAPKSFSQEFPNATKWMPWMPVIMGGLTGAGIGAARATSNQMSLSKWDKALDRAVNSRSPAVRELEATTARNIADGWPVKTGLDYAGKKAAEYSAPAVAGALEGGISANLPQGYNILNLKDENAERKSLQTYYRNLADTDPERARTKALLDDENVLPKGNLDYQAAMNFYSDWQKNALPKTLAGAAEGAGATVPGSTMGTMFSPWNRTLAIRHARTDAIRPPPSGNGSSPPTPPTPALPPGGGGGALPPPMPPQRALPPPLPPMAPPAPKATPDPATSVSATTTSKAPADLPEGHSWVDAGRGSKVKGPNGQWTTMDVVAQEPATKKLTKSKSPKVEEPEDDVAGFIAGKPVPKKADPELNEEMFRGRASGGKILDMARRYANGGSVLPPGLVAGPTGGREDALDVDVPNGCYVIPADAVSGIQGAGNNTEAGWKIWQSMLPQTDARANGGAVPIKISHGEGVVYPDQIAALGGGDLQQGHRVLDAIVQKIREDNINHLASLPPPAKS